MQMSFFTVDPLIMVNIALESFESSHSVDGRAIGLCTTVLSVLRFVLQIVKTFCVRRNKEGRLSLPFCAFESIMTIRLHWIDELIK
ncbi:hypothetical protein DMC15_11310 [Vibrio sp. 11986-1-5]|nr:hypothetical protein DMC15_11310 [Vibrio sp. 11986-1-5]